jgi:hypothetical protein
MHISIDGVECLQKSEHKEHKGTDPQPWLTKILTLEARQQPRPIDPLPITVVDFAAQNEKKSK